MKALTLALLGLAVLAAACAPKDGDGRSSPETIAEGRAVYVLNASTEQEAQASAMSICRGRGGNAEDPGPAEQADRSPEEEFSAAGQDVRRTGGSCGDNG